MEEKNLNMIKELSECFGPSGFEDDVLKIIREYSKDLGVFEEDSTRNLYLYRKENTGNKPILMLDAHTDEYPPMMVHYVRQDGLVKAWRRYGSTQYYASTKVLIRNNDNEDIEGIIVATKDRLVTEINYNDNNEMLIDIGATSLEEVENIFKIEAGNPICYATKFDFNKNTNIMRGKAFDDRLGVAAIINILENIKGVNLPFDIVASFSTQEEAGDKKGIKVAVNKINPDVSICLEGTPSYSLFLKEGQIYLKKGAALRLNDSKNIYNTRYVKFIKDISTKENIKLQIYMPEGGSTNSSEISASTCGANVVVISVPVRYAHTPCSYSSYEDYESVVRITTETIKALTPEIISNF